MGIGRLALGGGGTIIVLLVAWLFRLDPMQVLQQVSSQGTEVSTEQGPAPPPNTANDPQAKLVSVVLAETKDVWSAQFQKIPSGGAVQGREGDAATLVRAIFGEP
jgi:uncharacterized protein